MVSIQRLIAFLVLSACSFAFAREVFVSTSGKDTGDGTRQAPYRTVAKAVTTLKPGDICTILPGVYTEYIESIPSGEPGKHIVIRASEEGDVTLTGVAPVKGWERVSGDVWHAPVTKYLSNRNQVFVNGKACHRARWPNRISDDFLEWDGMKYQHTKSSMEELVCNNLPERPADYWKGATLWVMGGAKWTSWSTKVTSYDARRKALRFTLSGRAKPAGANAMCLTDRRGGYFYLLGDQREIDRPYEYYVDEIANKLYVQFEPGQDPNKLDVRIQVHANVINVSHLKHVHFKGFKVFGGNLFVTGNSSHCLFERLTCTWLGSLDGGDTGYGIDVSIGVMLHGTNHVFRDSEVAYSHGYGVLLRGSDHALINCHIHDIDFSGSYNCPVYLSGVRMLVSHNTIHDTGRDCLIPGGSNHVIQYNDIYNMGRICHDLGATYSCGSDGGGTEYHHNWVHDNKAEGTRMGIYLDNFTCNNFIYKNVVWNINGCDIRLNKPSHNNYVINNTMLGRCGNWGRWQTDWMYNCAYINNAVVEKIQTHPQLSFQGNICSISKDRLNVNNFMTYADGAGLGFVVPGITGERPSVGAYEPGENWRPGHDFSKRPQPVYRQLRTPLRNLIRDATFHASSFSSHAPWRKLGMGKTTLKHWPGGITVSYNERYSIINTSVGLTGDGDGLEQHLPKLFDNQKYEYSCWYRLGKDQKDAEIQLYIKEGKDVKVSTAWTKAKDGWNMLTLAYTSPAKAVPVTVGILKRGAGIVWVDSFSFVGIVPGMEPKLPGLAKLPKYRPKHKATPKGPLAPKRTKPELIPTGKVANWAVKEAPGRVFAKGKAATAELSHDEGVLRVSITVPLQSKPNAVQKPLWTRDDGMEVCFAYGDRNAKQTTYVLHGFMNGSHEASKEAGASDAEAKAVQSATTFTATLNAKSWTGRWEISLKALGLPADKGAIYDFNLGVYRKENRQWLQWAGTPGQTWLVKEAGQIKLD